MFSTTMCSNYIVSILVVAHVGIAHAPWLLLDIILDAKNVQNRNVNVPSADHAHPPSNSDSATPTSSVTISNEANPMYKLQICVLTSR